MLVHLLMVPIFNVYPSVCRNILGFEHISPRFDGLIYFPIQQISKLGKLAIKQNQIHKSNGNSGMYVKDQGTDPNHVCTRLHL